MTSKSNRAFRSWRRRMDYKYPQAAEKLGLCRTTVVNYELGYRTERTGEEKLKVDVPLTVLLACAAIEAGLLPVD